MKANVFSSMRNEGARRLAKAASALACGLALAAPSSSFAQAAKGKTPAQANKTSGAKNERNARSAKNSAAKPSPPLSGAAKSASKKPSAKAPKAGVRAAAVTEGPGAAASASPESGAAALPPSLMKPIGSPIGMPAEQATAPSAAVAAPAPGSPTDLAAQQAQLAAGAAEPPFMEVYPKLKDFLFKEPDSGFFIGFGISPIGVVKDRTMFSASIFQLHWIDERWDYEILNATYGASRAQSPEYQSTNFTFRTALKVKIGSWLSVGPLAGYEFVSFPSLKATLLKTPYRTYEEPFSSRGPIYGAIATQSFKWKDTQYLIQVNETVYQQSYSTTETPEGWRYNFGSSPVQSNRALIDAAVVFMVDVSFLY